MKHSAARRALAAGLGFATLTTALVAGASSAAAAPKKPNANHPAVDLQLLAINDFHGQLVPPTSSSSRLPGYADNVAFGGVQDLATQVKALEQQSKEDNSLVVAAGDLIGASPLISAAYHDEPAIEALNLLGLDYASVGNHEFDEGPEELLRMQYGGCLEGDLAPESCPDPDQKFEGADFQYLSANAFFEESGETVLPPYAVHTVDGIKVGFIGMTLENTPGVVTPSGVAGLDFADEAETANRYVRELQRQGVRSIVVLLHEGGSQTSATDVNGCNELTGAITEIVPRMSKEIDAIITGHTHQAYNCREVKGEFVAADSTSEGRLVTSASSFGRLVTDIDLTLDSRTGDVMSATSDNVTVPQSLTDDPKQVELFQRYDALVAPIANEVVGFASAELSNRRVPLYGGVLGESPLGNIIADAQRAATPGADLALMNPGGVRTSIAAGEITFAEAFAVQPFSNYLTTITLTDAQIQCVLEQQFAVGRTERNVLAPSGITYSVSAGGVTGPADSPCTGTRVPDDSVLIAGQPIATDGKDSYRVTVNNFLADGGDGFSVLAQGTDRVDVDSPEDDLAAFVAYLKAKKPIGPAPTDRISLLP
jgi:5'-nucleotidase